MTKSINKNLKIVLIAVFALALFALVNLSVGDNANAKGDNGNDDKWYSEYGDFNYYKKTNNNLPEITLDNDHKPTILNGKKGGKGFSFNGHRTMVGDIGKDGKNLDTHPGANDDFYFGNHLDYKTVNLEFGFAEYVDNSYQKHAENSFFVHYGKDCPCCGETQHYEIVITLYHYIDGGVKTWTINDGFCDFNDKLNNSEILERAGHADGCGPKLSDILAEVTPEGRDGYTFYDALLDGTIKAKVTAIKMDTEY